MNLISLKQSNVFLISGVVCFILTVTPALIGLHDLAAYGLLSSILVLGFYHYVLYQRISSLTTDEIDTVYYLGFLITLLALASTVIILAKNHSTDAFDFILLTMQFGLGLIATGYALMARVHLLLTQKNTESYDLNNLEQVLSNQIYGIIAKISSASDEFENLARSIESRLMTANERGISQISATYDKFSSIAESASEEVSKRLKSMEESVRAFDISEKQNDINKSLADLEVATDNAVDSMIDLKTSLSQSALDVVKFGGSAKQSANSLDEVKLSASELSENVVLASSGLKKLDASSVELVGSLTSTVAALEQFALHGSNASTQFSDSVGNIRAQMMYLVENLSNLGLNLGKEIEGLVRIIKLHDSKLIESIDQFPGAQEKLQIFLRSMQGISDEINLIRSKLR